jgi:hypothetical protein
MTDRIKTTSACERSARASGRMSLSMVFAQWLVFATCSTATVAAANELSVLINGKAVHMSGSTNNTLNERNWGLGLQYDWDRVSKNWIPFATASGLRDSNGNPSYYAGTGVMHRLQFENTHFDVGAVGFFMTRKGYRNGDPFVGVLPAFSVGYKSVALNITYVPKVDPKAVPLWFFQFKISLGQFR